MNYQSNLYILSRCPLDTILGSINLQVGNVVWHNISLNRAFELDDILDTMKDLFRDLRRSY